jgi:hypothetical protein
MIVPASSPAENVGRWQIVTGILDSAEATWMIATFFGLPVA